MIDETLPDDVSLLHLEARALLGTSLRKTLETAREWGALISIDLGAPIQGLATVPVRTLGASGCTVYGRRVASPAGGDLDQDALIATFCVAFVEGAAPVEATGCGVLVAATCLSGRGVETA